MLILIGLPGSGKSTAGRQLARRLGLAFKDADAEIESRAGMSVREYFSAHGEAAFRDLEEQILDELTQTQTESAVIIATGGGAVLRPVNRQRLRERGTVIYLRASAEQLAKRLRHDTKRPLLQVADPLKRLRALYEERDPLYRECAHYVVDTHGSSLPMLVNRVVMQLDLLPPHAVRTGA
ncbi:MAG: shikimate kinase [Pseudomonadota bacterium]|nr:shikimate kinase [Pseudomonadota bacterium]